MNFKSSQNFQLGNVNNSQFIQIKNLQKRCSINDGYDFPIYEQFLSQRLLSTLPVDVLCWSEDQLIGYAGIFFFSVDLPEVIILVDPYHRQQGIASQLLQLIKKTLSATQTRQFLLININLALNSTIKARGGSYNHAEFKMTNNAWVKKSETRMLVMKNIDLSEFESLITLHQHCFTSPEAHNRERFKNNLQESNCSIYFFYFEDELIGKLHMRENENQVYLSDISVLPLFQCKGFGRALMETWYQSVGSKLAKPLLLEIKENNKAAFYLYQSCGFKVNQRLEFWQFII